MKYAVTVTREQSNEGHNVGVTWTFTNPEPCPDGEFPVLAACQAGRMDRATFVGDTPDEASVLALAYAHSERVRYQHVFDELTKSIRKQLGL